MTDRTLPACSEATIDDVYGQLATLPSPGNRLVTVTVGGNDAGFADELENCFLSGCTDRQAEIEARVDGLLDPLTTLYEDIKAAAPGDRVLVGAYPLLVPDPAVRGWCAALTFLITSSEPRMIRSLGVRLNDVIDQAAARAGVTAVTTGLETEFTGHEACRNSSRDWIYGLKISFFGLGAESAPGPEVIARVSLRPGVAADFVSDSFHPTKRGQVAYADSLEDAYFGGVQ